MREVKFRAWNESTKSMERDIQNEYDSTQSNFGGYLNNKWWEVMQYTGLNDKNNKEIYEGDIVKVVSRVTGEFTRGRVVFENGYFAIDYDWNTHLLIEFHNIEVIGNIYEDKHLLEG